MKADGEKDFVLQLGKVRLAVSVLHLFHVILLPLHVLRRLLFRADHRGLLQHGLPLPALPAAGLRHLHRQVHTLIDLVTDGALLNALRG
jgi:hypothetical protein